ncbi:MAG: zinc ribbon domain-containing protein, partial [Phycisphaerae bacterium]|nr:zinc ribbon domain-containing protein [Phycisphaerae bacterium]
MKCKKCDSELRNGSAYCPECGKKVKKTRQFPWYFTDGKDDFGEEFGANCLLIFDIVTLIPLMVWI